MNAKSLAKLEYNKIIEKLVLCASSSLGREALRKLLPLTDAEEIKKAQTNTADALNRVYKKGSITFGGLKDIRASIMRLEVSSTLSAKELLDICSVLKTAKSVAATNYRDTSSANEDAGAFEDSLSIYFESLYPVEQLRINIDKCIISEDEISDDASVNLRNIRRHIREANDRIHTELNKIVASQGTRTYLQDGVITMRNGRYCVPVKAEYRNMIPGMVHDQSSTGATLFVEPMSVVKLNNELKELANKEQEEIEVILTGLSVQAAAYIFELKEDVRVLSELDFIFAKAYLARSMKASEPIINSNGYVNIKKGRHPLIDSKKVVPIDISLGKDFDLLVITGPNTGGKTVSLKTMGLFVLMGQAGLHIPAETGSTIAVFDEVFADIGDEQSIEQSLSTFSSHMVNIVSILKNVTLNSLVLFDELGAGTDPTEGSALAVAILDHLHKQGIRTMATTHYSEIKLYALETEGVLNASCEFDVESLMPTYRLLMGIPGKSNAFAISKRLGLEEFIIEDAGKRIEQDARHFEDVIADLEKSRVTIEKEKEEIKSYKEEIVKLKNELSAKQDKMNERADLILIKAREEANEILREAKKTADIAIRNVNKYGLSTKQLEEERTRLRASLEKTEARPKTSSPKKDNKPSDFTLGTSVKVLSLNVTGSICSKVNDKGEVYVQMGILRSQFNISDLEITQEEVKKETKTSGKASKVRMNKSATISSEINLIGMTRDEALAHLDKYIDDAYLSHIPTVRVVHGKGEGILRQAVHAYLKKSKYVKSYRLGVYGEGESGVTIVEFK